jgi:hypothetical protein
MAWIEAHQSLGNHPKTKKAAKLLGISKFEMIGRLFALWWWAADYAQDGDLSRFNTDDIEMAVEWEGEAGAFVRALVDCGFGGEAGFLEQDGDRLAIHDWWDYAGKLIEKRQEDAERKRASRQQYAQQSKSARPEDVQRTSDGRRTDGVRSADVTNIHTYIHTMDASPAEKTADAGEIVLPPQEETPAKGKRQPTPEDDACGLLAEHFAAVLHIPQPSPKARDAPALWYAPLRKIARLVELDISAGKQLITAAAQELDSKGMTIASPNSILKTAISLYGRNRRGMTANGTQTKPRARQDADGNWHVPNR